VNTVRTTTLLLAIAAAVILARVAGADAGTDYGNAHADALCSKLAENPSFDGVLAARTPTIGDSIEKGDLSPYQAGEALGTAVGTTCPQYVPLIISFAHRGTTLA
jgi:hypothetical protein